MDVFGQMDDDMDNGHDMAAIVIDDYEEYDEEYFGEDDGTFTSVDDEKEHTTQVAVTRTARLSVDTTYESSKEIVHQQEQTCNGGYDKLKASQDPTDIIEEVEEIEEEVEEEVEEEEGRERFNRTEVGEPRVSAMNRLGPRLATAATTTVAASSAIPPLMAPSAAPVTKAPAASNPATAAAAKPIPAKYAQSQYKNIFRRIIMINNLPPSCTDTRIKEVVLSKLRGHVTLDFFDGIYGGSCAVSLSSFTAVPAVVAQLNSVLIAECSINARLMTMQDHATFWSRKLSCLNVAATGSGANNKWLVVLRNISANCPETWLFNALRTEVPSLINLQYLKESSKSSVSILAFALLPSKQEADIFVSKNDERIINGKQVVACPYYRGFHPQKNQGAKAPALNSSAAIAEPANTAAKASTEQQREMQQRAARAGPAASTANPDRDRSPAAGGAGAAVVAGPALKLNNHRELLQKSRGVNHRVSVHNIAYTVSEDDMIRAVNGKVGGLQFILPFRNNQGCFNGNMLLEFVSPVAARKFHKTMQKFKLKARPIFLKMDTDASRDPQGNVIAGAGKPSQFDGAQERRPQEGHPLQPSLPGHVEPIPNFGPAAPVPSLNPMGFAPEPLLGSRLEPMLPAAPLQPVPEPVHDTYGLSKQYLDNLDVSLPLVSKVLLSNVDPRSTENSVGDLLSLAGAVITVQINRPLEQAIVEMGHPVQAVEAISRLHNRIFNERSIAVRLCRQRDFEIFNGLPVSGNTRAIDMPAVPPAPLESSIPPAIPDMMTINPGFNASNPGLDPRLDPSMAPRHDFRPPMGESNNSLANDDLRARLTRPGNRGSNAASNVPAIPRGGIAGRGGYGRGAPNDVPSTTGGPGLNGPRAGWGGPSDTAGTINVPFLSSNKGLSLSSVTDSFALGSERAGLNSAGAGRGGQNNVGAGRGGQNNVGAGRGGQNNVGAGRGGQNNVGAGRGGQNNVGAGRGGQNNVGAGRGGQNNASESKTEKSNASGTGKGGQSNLGAGRDGQNTSPAGRGAAAAANVGRGAAAVSVGRGAASSLARGGATNVAAGRGAAVTPTRGAATGLARGAAGRGAAVTPARGGAGRGAAVTPARGGAGRGAAAVTPARGGAARGAAAVTPARGGAGRGAAAAAVTPARGGAGRGAAVTPTRGAVTGSATGAVTKVGAGRGATPSPARGGGTGAAAAKGTAVSARGAVGRGAVIPARGAAGRGAAVPARGAAARGVAVPARGAAGRGAAAPARGAAVPARGAAGRGAATSIAPGRGTSPTVTNTINKLPSNITTFNNGANNTAITSAKTTTTGSPTTGNISAVSTSAKNSSNISGNLSNPNLGRSKDTLDVKNDRATNSGGTWRTGSSNAAQASENDSTGKTDSGPGGNPSAEKKALLNIWDEAERQKPNKLQGNATATEQRNNSQGGIGSKNAPWSSGQSTWKSNDGNNSSNFTKRDEERSVGWKRDRTSGGLSEGSAKSGDREPDNKRFKSSAAQDSLVQPIAEILGNPKSVENNPYLRSYNQSRYGPESGPAGSGPGSNTTNTWNASQTTITNANLRQPPPLMGVTTGLLPNNVTGAGNQAQFGGQSSKPDNDYASSRGSNPPAQGTAAGKDVQSCSDDNPYLASQSSSHPNSQTSNNRNQNWSQGSGRAGDVGSNKGVPGQYDDAPRGINERSGAGWNRDAANDGPRQVPGARSDQYGGADALSRSGATNELSSGQAGHRQIYERSDGSQSFGDVGKGPAGYGASSTDSRSGPDTKGYSGNDRYSSDNSRYGSNTGGYGANSNTAGYGADTRSERGAADNRYGSGAAGYGASSGGYGASSGGYGASSGGYGANAGGYGANSGGYGASSGAYAGATGGYGASAGGYGVSSGFGSQASYGAGSLRTRDPYSPFGASGGMGRSTLFAPSQSTKLLLNNLPMRVQRQDIMEMCSSFGMVRNIDLDPKEMKCRVLFDNPREAAFAARDLNDRVFRGSTLRALVA